jgi:RNA polymerase sigma-70 factor (ECF subfamily)
MAPSDEVLAERARAGDEDAFRLLFERHEGALQARVARRLQGIVRRKIGASDVLQETYLGAFRNLHEFKPRGEGSFEAWLFQILEHKLNDVLRRHVGSAKRGVGREITRGRRPDSAEVPAHDRSPSEGAAMAELARRVQEAMAVLPEHYRTILTFVQQEGLTLAEAGARMGRSRDAASKLYGRALARLGTLVREKRA